MIHHAEFTLKTPYMTVNLPSYCKEKLRNALLLHRLFKRIILILRVYTASLE